MQSVASETKTQSVTPPAAQPRSPVAPDRAAASPFESLLPDDGAQPAAPPPLPEPNKTARSERPEPTTPTKDSRPAGRADRVKTTKADRPDTAADPEKAEQTAGQTDAAGGGKSAGDLLIDATTNGDQTKSGKVAEGKHADRETGDDQTPIDGEKIDTPVNAQVIATGILPADAGKPIVGAATVNPAPAAGDTSPLPSKDSADAGKNDAPASSSAQVTAAVAVAVVPADESVKQAAKPEPKAEFVATDAAKATSAALLPAQNHDDKPDAANTPVQDTQHPQGDGKPQVAVADASADKQAISYARGETPLNSHRVSTADVAQPTADSNAAASTPRSAADVVQTLASTPSHNVAATGPAQTLAQNLPVAAPVPLNGVALAIASKVLEGTNRFEIRLDPPELGRIEVRLDVNKDGSVTSHLVAHRAETLDLLRREAAGLQRALEDAGLKTADNGLQFSLHNQSADQQAGSNSRAAQLLIRDETLDPVEPSTNGYAQLARLRGGLDIRV